jgi:hypothetical protein
MLGLLSTGLTLALLFRPPVVVEVERVILVPAPETTPVPSPEPTPSSPGELTTPSTQASSPNLEWIEGFRLRERVLRDGVAILPSLGPVLPDQPNQPSPPDLSTLRRSAFPTPGDLFP